MQFSLNGHSVFIDSGALTPEAIPAAASEGHAPILFVHGAGVDHRVWQRHCQKFRQLGAVALAVDLPGHGQSAGSPLASIEAMAAWILALATELGAASLQLVGHSMASLIALECAAMAPERLQRAVLVGTALPMPVSPTLLTAAHEEPELAASLVSKWSYVKSPRGEQLAADNLRLMLQQPKGALAVDLVACNAYARSPATLAEIATPLLLLTGELDKMTSPAVAHALAEKLPNARETVIPNAGHSMMDEAPETAFAALRGFLAR